MAIWFLVLRFCNAASYEWLPFSSLYFRVDIGGSMKASVSASFAFPITFYLTYSSLFLSPELAFLCKGLVVSTSSRSNEPFLYTVPPRLKLVSIWYAEIRLDGGTSGFLFYWFIIFCCLFSSFFFMTSMESYGFANPKPHNEHNCTEINSSFNSGLGIHC